MAVSPKHADSGQRFLGRVRFTQRSDRSRLGPLGASAYQLQIEDAELIGNFNTVIFVDASKRDMANSYSYDKCEASNKYSFSTHSLAPETILYLAEDLYDLKPKAFVFAIKGYEWELKNGLSKKGEENLKNAIDYFTKNIAF